MKNPNNSDLNSINKRIEFVMLSFGYPQKQFARKLGVNYKVVDNILNKPGHRPTMSLTENLCSIFPVRKEWLYAGGAHEPFTLKDLEPFMYQEDEGLTTLKKGAEKNLNDRMRMVRMSLGFSQATFASEIKVSRDIIGSIENGRQSVPPYILWFIAQKFDVNMNWIYYEIGEMFLSENEKLDKRKQKAKEGVTS